MAKIRNWHTPNFFYRTKISEGELQQVFTSFENNKKYCNLIFFNEKKGKEIVIELNNEDVEFLKDNLKFLKDERR